MIPFILCVTVTALILFLRVLKLLLAIHGDDLR